MLNFRKSIKQITPKWARKLYRQLLLPRSGPNFSWVLSHLKPAPRLVFDVGANIGDTTRQFLTFFPGATVYAFEPCSETFGALQKNLSRDTEHVRLYQLGFSSRTERGLLNVTSFHGANSLALIGNDYAEVHPHIQTLKQEEIQLVTMDEFVRIQGIEHIDLVKIDVEGFERQVLLGGSETFKTRVDTVLMEVALARYGFDSNEWIQLLSLMFDYGFDLVAIYDAYYNRWPKYGLRLEQMDVVFCKRGKVLFR